MRIILCLLGMVGSVYVIKYRQQIGDMFGEAEWMRSVGGVYNVVILCAFLLFFFSLVTLTGTAQLVFNTVVGLLPGS